MKSKTKYTLFGILFGFCFPLVANILLIVDAGEWSISTWLRWQRENRLLQIIQTAPFFLGVFAYFIGSRQDRLIALQAVYYRFVPKNFLQLIRTPKPSDVKIGLLNDANLTILFADVKNSTTLFEKHSTHTIMQALNVYFTQFHTIFQKHSGFVDKFVGDGVMAIFPRSPDDALKAAAKIVSMMNARTEQDPQYLPVDFGIGVAFGAVSVGVVGSEERMDTTVLGDPVHIADRMQKISKQLDKPIILDSNAYNNLSSESRDMCARVGNARLKGKSDPVSIYEYRA